MASRKEIIKTLKVYLKKDIADIKEAIEDHFEKKVSKKELLKVLKDIVQMIDNALLHLQWVNQILLLLCTIINN